MAVHQNEHDAKEHLLQYLSFYDIEKTYGKKKNFSKRGICIYIYIKDWENILQSFKDF